MGGRKLLFSCDNFSVDTDLRELRRNGQLQSVEPQVFDLLTLNPNLATAWYADAWLRIWRGEPEIALRHFAHVTRLSPFEPMMGIIKPSIVFAYCMAGQYEQASALAEQVLREGPGLHMGLRFSAASFALAGRLEDARKTIARLRQIDPLLRVSDLKELTPLRRPEDLALYEDSMCLAGLPE